MDYISSKLEVEKSILIEVFGSEFVQYLEEQFKPEKKPLDSFWSLLSALTDGIKTFREQLKVLAFLCTSGPPDTFLIKRIELIEQFFLEYHNITLEDFNFTNKFFEYDSNAIGNVILIFSKIIDEKSIVSLTNFLIAIVQKSSVNFTQIIPFYIETIKKILLGPNKRIIIEFLINFIDSVEGRIELTNSEYKIFKYPKNRRNLKIYFEDKMININIHPTKSSIYSIKNFVSAIKQLPLDSFSFDVNEITSDIKSIKIIGNDFSQLEPSQFECFPSNLLSNDLNFIQYIFSGLDDPSFSHLFLKILHRLKIPEYEKKMSDFIQLLSDPKTSPAHYQFLTEFFFMHLIGCRNNEPSLILQKNMEEGDYQQFLPLLNILLKNLIENKIPIYHQNSSIEILRLFIKMVDFNIHQFYNILNQFFTYPKCQGIVFLIAQFLIEKDIRADIRGEKLLKNLVLQINQTNFKAIKIIIQNLDGLNYFNDLILDILKNPMQYAIVSQFVSNISRTALKKYPEISDSIIEISLEYLSFIPCQIVCDVLSESFKIQNFDMTELLSEFFRVAITNGDLVLKKSILRCLIQMKDTENVRDSTVASILEQEFKIGHYDPVTFQLLVRYFNGLTNSGNTCYINSILQQLNSIDLFYEKLIADPSDNLRPYIKYLKGMFSVMRYSSDVTAFDTTEFCQLYQEFNPEFDVHRQQDADEFLLQLFNCIPKDCLKIFEGKITNLVQYVSSEKVETSDEEFLTLPLSLKNVSDFNSSLERYLKKCPVYDDGRIVAYRQIILKKLPQILIFHLHRFDFSVDSQQRIKINSYFSFPTALIMDDFANGENHESLGIYQLKGAIIHAGDAFGGHYMSVTRCNFKNAPERSDEDHWLLFNDSSVTGISESELRDICFGDAKDGCRNAYLLFYEKI